LTLVSVIDTNNGLDAEEGRIDPELQDRTTEAVFQGRCPKGFPAAIFKVARRKLEAVNAAEALHDLYAPPSNRLEALKGDRKGQHSIQINDQWRVCFRWTDDGPVDVEIVDYH
jgi:proteic killer suppression protein